jgi:hypothetical protein
MKRIFVLTVFLNILTNQSFTQVVVVPNTNLNNPDIMIIRNTRFSYDQIAGKPYLTDSFLLSKVFLKNKQIIEMKLRYDIYTDEFEIYNKQQIYYLVKTGFDSIVMNKVKFVYEDYLLNSKKNYAYFIVITEGKYTLLQKKRVLFFDQDKATPYSDRRPARFEVKPDDYYLKSGSDPALELTGKKAFGKEFPDLYKKAESFIKEKNISFSKQNDLSLLIQFLNSN